jgi:hypothetical protein
MFYSLLSLTALLLQLQGSSAAVPVVSTQTRAITATTARPSIAALNNLVVMGDATGTSSVGDISFSFYTYAVSTANVVTADDFVQVKSGTAAATVTTSASGDLAFGADAEGNNFKGLGHDIAIADESTVFVSQSNEVSKTGRVVVYEGNITSFEQTQLLIPYDGKHRLDSEAYFGESIAAKHDALAVGCQNCNTSAPIFSGAVYVYKPNKDGRWSESQVLSADGVLFMGERVAMHDKVLVAAGDDSSTFSRASLHNFDNVANTAVVFEEGPHGKFEQRQVIAVKSGNNRESITALTVFDETIAITTMGGHASTTRDKVYIYYPMNKRYGMEPKGKPSPQQWTNIQILTSSDSADVRYSVGAPDTSISMNTLMYLTTDGTNVAEAKSQRACLSCKFDAPTVTAFAADDALVSVVMAADANAFYTYDSATTTYLNKPVPNGAEEKCLTISLQDQYNDGWGSASLVVTSPSGQNDKFTLQCTTANPNVFKYCPHSQEAGKYHLHIENGEETPFGWEIVWKVAAGSSWYYGDRHTHMDFLWDDKYGDFHAGATKGLLPLIPTCKVCDPNKPVGKHRSLSNLRSLHHKGTTSSPTMTAAPTLTTTNDGTLDWHQFSMTASQQWFTADYNGAYWWISNADGSKLIHEGTPSCSAPAAATLCWVSLPDGDYRIRAGASVGDAGPAAFTWKFCGVNVQAMDTEFMFTVVDDQCYAGASYTANNLCLNTYKSDFFLNVELLLSGGAETLSSSDASSLKVALAETMHSVLGSVPTSSTLGEQEITSNGLKVSALLQFPSVPDTSALDNFVKETASASSLLKFELIGTQSSSAKFLQGEVSGVSILSASTEADAHDFSKVDESSFHTVTDHAWKTASVEQSTNNFNEYAKYVAEGAYALVAVAAVLAVSLFAKRAMAKTTVVEEDIKA